MDATPAISSALAESIRAYFREDRSRMTMMAARKFEVPEQRVVEALICDLPIVRLRGDAFRTLMEALPALGTMRVFVRSKAAVIEAVEDVPAVSPGDRTVFQRPDRHARHAYPPRRARRHLRRRGKWGHDTTITTHSFQFFDHEGNAAPSKAFTSGRTSPLSPPSGSRRFTGLAQQILTTLMRPGRLLPVQ